MYFAEQTPLSNEELVDRSLDLIQIQYAAPEQHYSIRHSLPIISEALPDDEILTNYLLDFHVNGRVVSYLQLQETRPNVAEALAESLQDVDYEQDKSVSVPRYLRHIQDPTNAAFALGDSDKYMSRPAAYDTTWPKWQPHKTRPASLPCDTETWKKLRKATAPRIVEKITELEEAKGDHPQSAIMIAAVCLISSRRTAPDSRPTLSAHMPILTAPSRLATAREVLRSSKDRYSRGALSIASALAWADQAELWDNFQTQVKEDLATAPDGDHSLGHFTSHSLLDGLKMAMRLERYDVALDIAKDDAPQGGSSPAAVRALCTIVSKFAIN